jgi:hypothetical protein
VTDIPASPLSSDIQYRALLMAIENRIQRAQDGSNVKDERLLRGILEYAAEIAATLTPSQDDTATSGLVTPQAGKVTAPFAMPVSADEINGECGHGSYRAFALFDANGKVICDTLNSDLILLDEDSYGDEVVRWDETGRKNMEHIAALLNGATNALATQPQAQPPQEETK